MPVSVVSSTLSACSEMDSHASVFSRCIARAVSCALGVVEQIPAVVVLTAGQYQPGEAFGARRGVAVVPHAFLCLATELRMM